MSSSQCLRLGNLFPLPEDLCTFEIDGIQFHCQLPIAPASILNKLYAWNISYEDNQLSETYRKELRRFSFIHTSRNKSPKEQECHSEAHQNGLNRAEKFLIEVHLRTKLYCFLLTIEMRLRL